MAKEITMPKMGYDMEQGTLAKWLKQPGDSVSRGEPIAEIETDKVTIEVEAFEAGTIAKLLVEEGETVPVGAPIALLEGDSDDDEDAPSEAAPTPAPEAVKAEVPATEKPAEAATPAPAAESATSRASGERILASPAARKIAHDRGVDLASLKGSGPGGRILRADVEGAGAARPAAAAAQPAAQTQPTAPAAPAAQTQPAAPVIAAPGAVEQPLSRLRQTLANRMAASQQQVPPFFVSSSIEMDAAQELLPRLQEAHGSKISVTELVIKACALALKKFPELNSTYAGDKILLHPEVNMSVAVATDAGLMAPVVKNCDTLSLGALSNAMRAVIKRVREGKATLDDLQGGTFTVSNLGMYDVASFIAIVTPPQVAILAMSSTSATPVVRDGEIVVRQMMEITLSSDHRVTDGATAAQFLQEVKALLQNPYRLLL